MGHPTFGAERKATAGFSSSAAADSLGMTTLEMTEKDNDKDKYKVRTYGEIPRLRSG